MTRVLIVDDEIDTLNLLRMILELSGYQAVTTLNSVDAITLAELEHPDCVLLDIMMPHLDGFTLCKMMRLHPATAHLPIVFVTAYSALDLEDRRVDAGADLVLPKPIGMDALIDTVDRAITLRNPPAPPTPPKQPEIKPEVKPPATPVSTPAQAIPPAPAVEWKPPAAQPPPPPAPPVAPITAIPPLPPAPHAAPLTSLPNAPAVRPAQQTQQAGQVQPPSQPPQPSPSKPPVDSE